VKCDVCGRKIEKDDYYYMVSVMLGEYYRSSMHVTVKTDLRGEPAFLQILRICPKCMSIGVRLACSPPTSIRVKALPRVDPRYASAGEGDYWRSLRWDKRYMHADDFSKYEFPGCRVCGRPLDDGAPFYIVKILLAANNKVIDMVNYAYICSGCLRKGSWKWYIAPKNGGVDVYSPYTEQRIRKAEENSRKKKKLIKKLNKISLLAVAASFISLFAAAAAGESVYFVIAGTLFIGSVIVAAVTA